MNTTLLSEAVQAYLEEHFERVEIRSETPYEKDGAGRSFLIAADGVEYRFNVHDAAVAGLDRDAIVALLTDARAESVMRDLAGFPVTLTVNGCIFDDV